MFIIYTSQCEWEILKCRNLWQAVVAWLLQQASNNAQLVGLNQAGSSLGTNF